jgi:hypothetical protein
MVSQIRKRIIVGEVRVEAKQRAKAEFDQHPALPRATKREIMRKFIKGLVRRRS